MHVDPEFRGSGLGKFALEAVAAIHTARSCDFTLLVADDDGSGRLVRWYENNGFSRAPELQDMMGSPGEKFGISMIAPARAGGVGSEEGSFFDRYRIRWW